MSNLTETSTFEPGVYQLETSDPVLGGPGGISNLQPQQLANRTKYLKDRVDALEAAAPGLATQEYVQSELAKLDSKQSARVATTAAISLSGLQTIDGVTLNSGDRVLVKDQTLASQNGVYVVAGSGWARATDANDSAEVTPGLEITIEEGTANGDSRWRLVSNGPLILGTSQLVFQNVTYGLATIDSPNFTGNPSAPTPTSGDNDTSLATTAFVFNAIDGLLSISVAGGADVNLTAAQAGVGILKLTGALSANINLIFPANSGQWIVENATSGSYNLTLKHAAGSGVVAPQGFAVVVYGDGTNMKFASSAAQTSFNTTPVAPAAGTTSFTVLGGYTPGNILVEKNGVMLQPSEYTATDGATITGLSATIAGDTFTVYAFKSFTVANAVLRSGDAMAGPLLLAANSTTPTPAAGDSSTKVANTAFVQANRGGIARITATGNWTVPDGVTSIKISAVAAGGGGGGAAGNGGTATSAGGGGGGAAGQSIIEETYSVTPGQVIPITMGAAGNFGAGAGAAVNGAAGTAGGNLVIGSLVTLTGGGAGGGGVNSGSNGSGGSGGSTGGARGMYGFDGGAGASGGVGGSSPFGGGGGNGHGGAGGGNTSGIAGFGYGSGGGGGGAVYTATALGGASGGAGAPGLVIIRW